MRRAPHWLEIEHRRIRLGERTLVMGIVNVTPDSFSDGGRYLNHKTAVRHGMGLVEAGADWIDVGGESTRPGSKQISAEEELHRVLPVIRALSRRMRGTPISIDTTKADVAAAALDAGATIINDVSGLRFDPRIAELARRSGAALILMHMRGRPETMQQGPFARDIWKSLREELGRSVRKALAAGVRRSQILIDPGLGFGKSRQQNYQILADLEHLQSFHLPILVGSSRKSFVRAAARDEETDRLKRDQRLHLAPRAAASGLLEPADAAAVVAAIYGGAHVVRVHDVRTTLPAVRLADAILASGTRHS